MFLKVIEDELTRQHSLPENFDFFKWRVLQRDPELIEFTGGIFRLLKSGKRAGCKTWDGRDKSKDRTFYVTGDQAAAMTKNWIARTGLCPKCAGKREVMSSCGVLPDGGSYVNYRPCSECKGTGTP
jgi:hypothetical protein